MKWVYTSLVLHGLYDLEGSLDYQVQTVYVLFVELHIKHETSKVIESNSNPEVDFRVGMNWEEVGTERRRWENDYRGPSSKELFSEHMLGNVDPNKSLVLGLSIVNVY